MPGKRINEVLENYKAYKELKEAQLSKFAAKDRAIAESKNTFLKDYHARLDKREKNERLHGKNLAEAKNYYFGNALKGIYIGALEAATLTDDAVFLAENMVDSYINENGGYDTIMSNVKSDTYLLAKIRRVVEDAAEDEVKNLEDETQEIEKTDNIEVQNFPEDEVDQTEVSNDTQLTTANITDIVSALNKSGLEIVKKGEEADNFKEGEPESPDNKPDIEVSDTEVSIDEPAPETTDAEPATDAEQPATTDAAPEEPAGAEEPSAPATTTAEAPSTPDAATEELPATIDAEPAEEESTEDNTEEVESDDVDELDADLANAEDHSEEDEEDKVADDDNLDPDTVAVNDDEESEEDSDDIDLSDEDFDDDDDLGDEDEEDIEDDESDEDIDIDGDGEPDIGDVDEPEPTVNVDPNKTMMDELENEKEVQDAIELIRNRVADAEEAFIKRNQEDKQKMDDILAKISQNVATVEKLANNDSDKAETQKANLEESTRLYKQKIKDMNLEAMSIFSRMTKNISESIIKDPKKVNMFLNESGMPDFGLITETAKVMYTFLETLNTLQLEDVNGNYIMKAINGQI